MTGRDLNDMLREDPEGTRRNVEAVLGRQAKQDRERLNGGTAPDAAWTPPLHCDSPGDDTEPHKGYSPRPRLHLADVARWSGKEPEPLRFSVADIVPRCMVTLLVADGGAGKSLLAQTMLTAVAADIPFLGLRVEGGTALGYFVEDPEAVLHIRHRRILDALGLVDVNMAGRLFEQSYAGTDAALWASGRPTKALSELEESLKAVENPSLLVLDNAALVFRGNESDRNEVTAFINMLNGLAARCNIAIVLIAHTSKSQGDEAFKAASGSTAWVWAARSCLRIRPPKDEENAIALEHVKSNHAAKIEPIRLIWRSGVLMLADSGASEPRKAEMRQTFLDCLDECDTRGQSVSASKRGQYAPKVFLEMRLAKNRKATIKELADAMDELFEARRIRLEEYDRRGYQRIIRAALSGSSDAD